MAQSDLSPLPKDHILQDRYAIVELLAADNNNVYLGRDRKFSNAIRNVAIKEFVISTDTDRDNLIRKFDRQASILAQLSHPTIPQIYDYFDLGDRAYIVIGMCQGFETTW
jgi:serine/threonine protein kinase